jgi:hypothetical protein
MKMAVPKPRREGQSGGMSHRDSYRGFRNSGGSVKPPKKGCGLTALILAFMLVTPVASAVGMVYWHTA